MKAGSFVLSVVLPVFIVFGLAACQKKVVTQPDALQQEQEKKTEVGQQQQGQETVKVTDKKPDVKGDAVDTRDKGEQYVEGKESIFSDILFDYDKYDVKETYKQLLQTLSSWMAKNSTARLSIEGHCDERGTNEYNLALGDRRAKAVKDYLITLGVASGRIDVISYGEEQPVCRDQNEDCWAKNRRAHFTVLTKVGK